MSANDDIMQERLSEASGFNAQVATKHLARAAACEEGVHDGSHGEGQLWFLVRAMCNEHGFDIEDVKRAARGYAIDVCMKGELLMIERVILVYRDGYDGHTMRRYCARDTETGVVGVYTVRTNKHGEDWSGDHDTHVPIKLADDLCPHGTHNDECEFVGGPAKCAGGSAGVIPDETGRWRRAISMTQ